MNHSATYPAVSAGGREVRSSRQSRAQLTREQKMASIVHTHRQNVLYGSKSTVISPTLSRLQTPRLPCAVEDCDQPSDDVNRPPPHPTHAAGCDQGRCRRVDLSCAQENQLIQVIIRRDRGLRRAELRLAFAARAARARGTAIKGNSLTQYPPRMTRNSFEDD